MKRNGDISMKALKHLQTINHHKLLVMKHCFKVGLYKQGLLHDLSKYSPTEFLVGCKYYQGTRSPNNAEREATGYSTAWLHHKGRNKHHYEYWIDYSIVPGEGIVGQKMPVKYVYEMFMDRIAASKTYLGDKYTDKEPLQYYEKGAAKLGKMIHPETAALIHKLLKGLLHDLSKYSPTEFLVGCKYYQGTRSPNNAEREATGYSTAWLHHKGRNKHHYEYWIDYSIVPGEGIVGQKMPVKYVYEMFMDRIAASKTYLGDKYTDKEPLQYYEKGAAKLGKMIHPETAALIHKLLKMLAEKGERATFKYVREQVRELKRQHMI